MNWFRLIAGSVFFLFLTGCSGDHGHSTRGQVENSVLRQGKAVRDVAEGPILLVTHPSRIFDMNEVAKPVISKILREYIEGGRPHYVMTSDLDSQIYYPDDYLRSNRYISFSGAHALTFPKARKFILAGGHLLFCLCETLRDLILGMPTNVKLELVFLADGIYLPGPNGDGTWGKSNELQRPIKLLSTFLEDFSDDYLIRFVETEMLHENMLCQQNPFPTYTLLPANQITIEIQRDGIPIGTIGQGPRFLIFNFTDSTSI